MGGLPGSLGHRLLPLAEGGAFRLAGLAGPVAAHRDLAGGAQAAFVISAGFGAAADLAAGVGGIMPDAVLGPFCFGVEGAAAGVAALAGMVAAHRDAGQAAAPLGVVGAGLYAALQVCHGDSLPFRGCFTAEVTRRMVTAIVWPFLPAVIPDRGHKKF